VRRVDKEITAVEAIVEVIRQCQVCRIGLAKDNLPYIVPVSFGYVEGAIYFHTAVSNGMKIEYISSNSTVCFEFEHNVQVVAHDQKPCDWSFTFQSVIGFGQVLEMKTDEEKRKGLGCIMAQYSKEKWDFNNIPLTGVKVWKIVIESMTGKQSLNYSGQ
jgi:hypothetical protein